MNLRDPTIYTNLFTDHNVELSKTQLSLFLAAEPDNITVLPVYSHEQCEGRALFESTESIEACFYLTISAWCLWRSKSMKREAVSFSFIESETAEDIDLNKVTYTMRSQNLNIIVLFVALVW